jgi:hypothetical protein
MSLIFKRWLSKVLPWSWQRRGISRAAEMILSNVNMYATVTTYLVDGPGPQRLLMELRSPVAVPADALEQLHVYVARKLEQLLGLRVQSHRIYLVSLPPVDARPIGEVDGMALARTMQMLPMWPAQRMPAANDAKVSAQTTAASGPGPAASSASPPRTAAPAGERANPPGRRSQFDLPEDPRFAMVHGIEVEEVTHSQFHQHDGGFERTQPFTPSVASAGAAKKAG